MTAPARAHSAPNRPVSGGALPSEHKWREFEDRRRDESGWPTAFVLDSKTAELNEWQIKQDNKRKRGK